ncbi:MAG: hypothetical protein J3K34DRAFT_516031 [Monoraphidium minutum]|nr:MAG: hypothetical protein J3K34DRAFT_516031 [Monoraphidium minutum]
MDSVVIEAAPDLLGAASMGPSAGALALALHQHMASECAAPPTGLHRRLLRFVFGPLARMQRGQGDPQQPQQQQPETDDALCGASDDGTEYSEDVLGMSPFASCPDLQEYRRLLAERRQARAARGAGGAARRQEGRAAAAAAEQQQQQQQQQQQSAGGPLRRALQWLLHGARAAARCVSPQGPGQNDATAGERVVNILTSIPFVIIGMHSLRCADESRRRFGAAFITTGAVAGLYHASSGAARLIMRKLDYWSIAVTSSVLRGAAGVRVPLLVNALAAALTPLKPTLVSGANLAIIEARYLVKALHHAPLRPLFGAHVGSAAAGLLFFSLEDVLVLGMGAPPVVHSLWHCLSAASLGLIGPLLSHCGEGALLLEGAQLVAAAGGGR